MDRALNITFSYVAISWVILGTIYRSDQDLKRSSNEILLNLCRIILRVKFVQIFCKKKAYGRICA